jgi:hypothetical protein
LREVLGVVVMGAGLLLLYFCFAEGDAAESVLPGAPGFGGLAVLCIAADRGVDRRANNVCQ